MNNSKLPISIFELHRRNEDLIFCQDGDENTYASFQEPVFDPSTQRWIVEDYSPFSMLLVGSHVIWWEGPREERIIGKTLIKTEK